MWAWGICKYLTASEELKLRAVEDCYKWGHQQEPSSEAATEIASTYSSQQILFSNWLVAIKNYVLLWQNHVSIDHFCCDQVHDGDNSKGRGDTKQVGLKVWSLELE